MDQEFASPLLERAVTELSRLPGVGRKTALRLALHLLRHDAPVAEALGQAILDLRRDIRYCSVCHNISDTEVCPICASPGRDHATVAVVENIRDVMIIERTGQFSGVYHVLGGLISPIDGIGPERLAIAELVDRVKAGGIREVILALSPTVEGDTTNFYIYRKIAGTGVRVTRLARGISVGGELEYTDEVTLGQSLAARTDFST